MRNGNNSERVSVNTEDNAKRKFPYGKSPMTMVKLLTDVGRITKQRHNTTQFPQQLLT